MINFTSFVSTVRLSAWRWRRRLSNPRFACVPIAGEAHLARADHLYCGYLDYNGALAELETARQTLPNDPRLFELKGLHRASPPRW